jgi:hypothetical protein
MVFFLPYRADFVVERGVLGAYAVKQVRGRAGRCFVMVRVWGYVDDLEPSFPVPQKTEGEGRVQTRGEPVVTIRAGDIVFTPDKQWDWHGAAPDLLMTHLAISEGDADRGEDVTEAGYRGETE